MSKEKKERKFESASQDFLEMEFISIGKRAQKPKQKKEEMEIQPVDNQLDVITKLIKFLKE